MASERSLGLLLPNYPHVDQYYPILVNASRFLFANLIVSSTISRTAVLGFGRFRFFYFDLGLHGTTGNFRKSEFSQMENFQDGNFF